MRIVRESSHWVLYGKCRVRSTCVIQKHPFAACGYFRVFHICSSPYLNLELAPSLMCSSDISQLELLLRHGLLRQSMLLPPIPDPQSQSLNIALHLFWSLTSKLHYDLLRIRRAGFFQDRLHNFRFVVLLYLFKGVTTT